MTHVFLLVVNRYGVLARITAVVCSGGTNIDSAAAYPVVGSDLSVVHLRMDADFIQLERIKRKLTKLVEVVEVRSDGEQTPLAIDFAHDAGFAGRKVRLSENKRG